MKNASGLWFVLTAPQTLYKAKHVNELKKESIILFFHIFKNTASRTPPPSEMKLLHAPLAVLVAFATSALAADPIVVQKTLDFNPAMAAGSTGASANAMAGPTITVVAFCPPGRNIVGGGARTNNPANVFIAETFPSSGTSWTGTATSINGSGFTLTVFAVCL
ncbi:hypothetical protein GGI12_000767 [Dipsacomyces acuminosporus]|nr:hypothetical protein GGI12_000767 [Dipsacomyces acuminosporus]